MDTFINILVSLLAVSGIGALWSTFLHDSPRAKATVKKIYFVGSALTCRLCSTFWLSFFFLLAFNPWGDINIPLRLPLPDILANPAYFFVLWMAFGALAMLTRFLTQELFSIGTYLERILHDKIHPH
ncbi:MAG: hypothetical protein AAB367_01830 [Patescibacteria group bacterium]